MPSNKIYQHEKNILDYYHEMSVGTEKVSYPPRSIWIETINFCTLKCKFCGFRTQRRENGKMSLDDFKLVIDKIDQYLTEYGDKEMTEIALTRYGEPLIQPDIKEFVEYAITKGLYVYIPTNGTIMIERKRKLILDSGVHKMNISVDVMDDKRHKEIMGVPSKIRMTNILSLFKEKLERNLDYPVIEVSMVKFPGYEKEVELFTKFFSLVSANRTNLGDMFNMFGAIDMEWNPKNKSQPCFAPWHTMGIYWDGRVNFCLPDPEGNQQTIIGNIYEESMENIWNGPRAQEIRNSVFDMKCKNYQICKKCNVNTYDRYQIKPFPEMIIKYYQRMKSLDPRNITEANYRYLSHLQSIESGKMMSEDKDKSLSIIKETIERLERDESFICIARDIVDRHYCLKNNSTELINPEIIIKAKLPNII